MYADTITESMRQTIDETMRRREKQLRYNADHNITPHAVMSQRTSALAGITAVSDKGQPAPRPYFEPDYTATAIAAEPKAAYMPASDLEKAIATAKRRMEEAAKKLEFIEAAQWRDEMIKLEDILKEKKK